MDRHLLAAALLMASTSTAAAQSSWLTMGEATYQQIKQAGHRVTIRANRLAQLDSPALAKNLYMVEVNSRELHRISGTLHRKLRHCGGYMYHASEADARKALEAARPVRAATRPSYAVVNQATVAPLLAQMDAGRIEQTIRQLSNFVNRYYTSAHGDDASNWLRANWEALGKGQPSISVEQITHAGYLPGAQVSADRCGYACSEHASWNALGFAAAMPFQAMLSHTYIAQGLARANIFSNFHLRYTATRSNRGGHPGCLVPSMSGNGLTGPIFRFAKGDQPTHNKDHSMQIQKRTLPAALALLMTGLFASGAVMAQSKSWITVGDQAFAHLQKAAPHLVAKESRMVRSNNATEKVHLVQVDDDQMSKLSSAIHHELKRCGGFMFHSSETEGEKALSTPVSALATTALLRPAYVIDNQATVAPVLSQMQAGNIAVTIGDLSSFVNRFYTTTGGTDASNWLRTKWAGMATGRSDITVTQFAHTGYPQKSVIFTIAGTDNAAQVVVLGGHLDSTIGSGTGETSRAPGADDDASGIASMTEALRAMIASGYKPRRTINMIGYAAEEVGLRGSQAIAQNFKANNVSVVGVMQLDMTNYKGAANDIYIFTDYTDSLQNDFVGKLITAYQPTLTIGYDRCGYGCSDHASWTAQGYPASMPFEATMSSSNRSIHTVNDTYATSGNQANHALKFARLAASFAMELGSDGPGLPPPLDRVDTFSGTLSSGQTRSFGPFKVGASGSLKAGPIPRQSAIDADTGGVGDPLCYQPSHAGGDVVLQCLSPLTVAGDLELAAEAGRAAKLRLEYDIAAACEKLDIGVETPVIAHGRPTVKHDDCWRPSAHCDGPLEVSGNRQAILAGVADRFHLAHLLGLDAVLAGAKPA